jgi:hypothetical protein|tara:strand:+ start:1244 stop:1636 length:393 start_codon:yes stop_codon:yes gene_type:complete
MTKPLKNEFTPNPTLLDRLIAIVFKSKLLPPEPSIEVAMPLAVLNTISNPVRPGVAGTLTTFDKVTPSVKALGISTPLEISSKEFTTTSTLFADKTESLAEFQSCAVKAHTHPECRSSSIVFLNKTLRLN